MSSARRSRRSPPQCAAGPRSAPPPSVGPSGLRRPSAPSSGHAWVDPAAPSTLGIVNPATEEDLAQISLGSRSDVDRAAKAARRAFATYSVTSVEQRLSWLQKIVEGFRASLPELARMMTLEMGAPITFATQRQATVALFHFEEAARVLATYKFEERMGNGIVRREPIGVCGLITPWNWPLNQIACKVAPALAAGCTVVLKPREIARSAR